MKSFPSLKPLLDAGEVVEIRGDGKAGSGLLMATQTLASAMGRKPNVAVNEWPLFSSARKGASVRAYMRIALHPIHTAASIVQPHVAILLDEVVAKELDFAAGMSDGIYLVNTPLSAKETAEKYRLPGTTITVDGDTIAEKHIKHRIGNIPIFAILVRISGVLSDEEGRKALLDTMKKRRLPEAIQASNIACYDESLNTMDVYEVRKPEWSHKAKQFEKFPKIPFGAQSQLRTSLANKTSRYRPAGKTLSFEDPLHRCTGCSLCVINCPEDIITFNPDEKRGIQVTGANIVEFCKLCEECIRVCPVDLFKMIEETRAE